MALEAAAIACGLAGGVKLWSYLQAELDELRGHPDHETAGADAAGAADSGRGAAAKRKVEGTLTVMLVGDSRIGKTLFCSRVVASTSRQPLAEDEGLTFAPTWLRAEMDVQLDESERRETRLCFHLLDTPGREQFEPLVAPFYRDAAALVLMFDVGSAASFMRLQSYWLTQTQRQRKYVSRQTPGSIVVLAHVLDERKEREVTRRDASNWCLQNQLPYFETHYHDNSAWKRMLVHLARVCLGYATSAPAAAPAAR